MPDRPRAQYKIVLLGESQVGKTSLVHRYVNGTFGEAYLMTLGTSLSKRVELLSLEEGRGLQVDLTIWDIMGNRRIMDLVGEAYLDGARGALAVFDISRRATLGALEEWIAFARRQESRIPIVVLGNKSDLVDQREVTNDEAKGFCRNLEVTYFATSAKTGLNVDAAFRHLSFEVLRTFALIHPAAEA